MKLPNLDEARKRTKNEIEFVTLDQNYDANTFKNQKYFLRTYGCQMNVHDGEEIAARLETLGFTSTEELTEADIVILNTCAIRENAHDKLYGFLGRCKHEKEKNNKDLIIGICGCMAQEENVVEELMKKHPYVDIVFGTHNIHELQDLILERKEKQNIQVYSCEGKVYENIPYKRDSEIKAWVNIQYGCDKFCTYCIVPYTRGKQRSRKSSEILKEVQELKDKGYKEITLLGQNVNAYGKELPGELSFAELLSKVSEIGIPRVRFVTSHPWDFTDEMIKVIAEKDNIMPYIHLPLQSGSSRILKLMGRRYTKEEYIELYDKIRNTVPNCSITTDIIVGFPNESDEDYEETLNVVNHCKYDSAFTFIYSPREGTPAAKMPDAIDMKTKEERLYKLNELINSYSNAANQAYLNKVVPVLIEGISEKDPNKVFGYTDTMKLVNVINAQDKIGQIIDVKITDAKSFSLDGEAI
ncbi:MAG: tRNA (N6-isopentenyl adenosine(37)-C2)-methylthiotransferase MiaB [Firmicutes bacterium]|nr:tRNA (N6-isopentenyl adenosine(37)-C2)-methylthiotransferase MiaB [Bacillota bacterium]